MIQLDDPLWQTFIGGYRTPYDASVRLRDLESGAEELDSICDEFWDELHHQGDVDIASYAVVPQLVRICIARNLLDTTAFALVATVEECRIFNENPPLPKWLENDYLTAVRKFAEFGAQHFTEAWSEELTRSFLSVAAFAKNSPSLGRLLINISNDEADDALEKFFG